ncbi:hypothetical protein BT69DRAFT_1347304 [Atractiella rhizophila]|nr:hypothetical protein BT69DRAFT_1347304 [Atractiella rhizophila]
MSYPYHNDGRRNAGYGNVVVNAAEERFKCLTNIIGFPIEPEQYQLWLPAITHSSHAGNARGSNAGLARLGDLAMKTVQTAVLYRAGLGDNGRVHRDTIQGLLAQVPLEKVCRRHGLDDLVYQKGMATLTGKCCADLVQAIIGAVYIDCVSRQCNPMEHVEAVMRNLGLLDDPSEPQQAGSSNMAYVSPGNDYAANPNYGYYTSPPY